MPSADPDFEALIADLREDPNAVEQLELDDEQLLELQRRMNPYANVVGPQCEGDDREDALVSYTNITEDYAMRFALTGTVGFLFRMCREWDVPAEDRRWKPDVAGALKAQGMKDEPFAADDLERMGKDLVDHAAALRKAAEAADAACKKVEEYNEKEMSFSEEEMQGSVAAVQAGKPDSKENPVYLKMVELNKLMKAADDAESARWGILYTATVEVRNMGLSADLRMPATEESAMQFTKAKSVIQDHPDRFNGLLPRGELEVPADVAKGMIRHFLENYFEYDPDAHVRKAYDEFLVEPALGRRDVEGLPESVLYDPHDPDRIPFRTLLREAPPQTSVEADVPHLQALRDHRSTRTEQHRYNTLCHLLQCPETREIARYVLSCDATGGACPAADSAEGRLERWRQMLLPELAAGVVPAVPPQDTFHRLHWYCDANMEALRAATNTIYNEKPDIDFVLLVIDTKKGKDAELKEWAEKFRDENQDKVISDIRSVPMHKWVPLGSFQVNRDRVDFYNNQTEVLRRIMDRHERDQKLGAKLMANRVHKKKAANIREAGPDAAGLSNYMEKQGPSLPGVSAPVSMAEKIRLARTRGDIHAARELEQLEQYDKQIGRLEEEQKLRTLTSDEEDKLKELRRYAAQARDSLNVPDNSIEIPVWRVNPGTGTVDRDTIYTKATGLGDDTVDTQLAADNVAAGRAKLAAQAAAASKKNPADFYPAAARDIANDAFKRGLSAPPLGPHAQAFLDFQKQEKSVDDAADEAAAGAPQAAAVPVAAASAIDAAIAKVVGDGR